MKISLLHKEDNTFAIYSPQMTPALAEVIKQVRGELKKEGANVEIEIIKGGKVIAEFRDMAVVDIVRDIVMIILNKVR